jgi:hypothetical protein
MCMACAGWLEHCCPGVNSPGRCSLAAWPRTAAGAGVRPGTHLGLNLRLQHVRGRGSRHSCVHPDDEGAGRPSSSTTYSPFQQQYN